MNTCHIITQTQGFNLVTLDSFHRKFLLSPHTFQKTQQQIIHESISICYRIASSSLAKQKKHKIREKWKNRDAVKVSSTSLSYKAESAKRNLSFGIFRSLALSENRCKCRSSDFSFIFFFYFDLFFFFQNDHRLALSSLIILKFPKYPFKKIKSLSIRNYLFMI